MIITVDFSLERTPLVKEKMMPTNMKMNAMPNRWICDTRASDGNDAPPLDFALAITFGIVVQKSFVLKLDLPSNCEQRLKFRLVKGTNFLVTFVFFFHQALQGFRLPWHSLQAFPQVLPE